MKATLVDLIRRRRKISSADLAQLTRKHKSTISPYVQGLLASSIIREAGTGESGARGGKPRQYLELNPDYCYAIGVDAGATRLKGGVYDFMGRQLLTHEVTYTDAREGAAFLADLYRFIGALRDLAGAVPGKCLGIGVGFSGHIDGSAGRILQSKAIGLRDYDLAGDLAERFGLPARIRNDANAALLGEKWFVLDYEDDPPEDALYFFIDNFFTSVGFGLLINGNLYEGAQHFAGELSNYATDRGVVPELMEGMSACDVSSLAFVDATAGVGHDGDNVARRIFDIFSAKLVYAFELLNPGTVIVGGNFDADHAFFLAPFIEYAGRRLRASFDPYIRVELKSSGIPYPPVCAGAVVPLFQDLILAL